MFPIVFRHNGRMEKRFFFEDPGGPFVVGIVMNRADCIFCGAVSDDEIGKEAEGLGTDNCLYLIWSP